MSAFHDLHNEALSGYRDLRDFTPPPPPLTQRDADWIAAEHAGEITRINRVVASRMADDKADRRARSARDYATEIEQIANHLARLMGAARTDGFGVVGAEEMKDLARNAVWRLREQQEQVHG